MEGSLNHPVFAGLAALAALLVTAHARAGAFDSIGAYHADPDALFFQDFSQDPDRYLPEGLDPSCEAPMFQILSLPDAIEVVKV